VGLTEDLTECDVVLSEEDIAKVVEQARFGVMAQTNAAGERVRELVQRLHERFPAAEIRFIDTVCQPTSSGPETRRWSWSATV